MFDRNAWNHLTVHKQMRSGSFKNVIYKIYFYKSYIYIYIYIYKQNLVLNNLLRLTCHKTQPTNQPNLCHLWHVECHSTDFMILSLLLAFILSRLQQHSRQSVNGHCTPLDCLCHPYLGGSLKNARFFYLLIPWEQINEYICLSILTNPIELYKYLCGWS